MFGHWFIMMRSVAIVALLPLTAAVAVKSEVISVTGEFCGFPLSANETGVTAARSTYKATVWYPTDDSKKYPVLSFAHGATVSDPKEYSGTVAGVAEAGYIIVALNGCPASMSEWKAQVSSLKYMLTQEQTLKNIIDYDAPTGVFGHSMGGQSTICSASDAESVKQAKIATAVAMHPGLQVGPSKPIIPILYFAGQVDSIVPSSMVRSKYANCPHNVDRGYAVFKGYTHFSPAGPLGNHEIQWIADMMNCYVKKNATGCTAIFGDGNGQASSLCSSGQTSHCEVYHADGPTPQVIV